jgi:hypothetical protein
MDQLTIFAWLFSVNLSKIFFILNRNCYLLTFPKIYFIIQKNGRGGKLMDWLEMLQQIFNILIVPVLTAVSLFLVRFIQSKTNELKAKTNDETLQKYMDMLNKTITDCVLATNQTYVESLKGQNAFDKNAQLEAFKKTYDAVMGILTEDAKEYLNEALGDLSGYITTKIESEVNINKAQPKKTEG